MEGKKELLSLLSTIISNNEVTQKYFCLEEPNLGVRKTMEDFIICEPDLFGDGSYSLFVVLDGHGGSAVASFVRNNYSKVLKNKLEIYRTVYPTPKIIVMSIDHIENQIKMIGGRDCGTTFCGVFIDKSAKKIHTINIGDSKMAQIKCDKNKDLQPRFLTVEHKVSNLDEIARIKKSGGVVINGRIGGNLLITRSLGDFDFKKYGLICTPETNELPLETDQIIIIASDGVWDVITIEILEKIYLDNIGKSPEILSKAILKASLDKGSLDNISIITIFI